MKREQKVKQVEQLTNLFGKQNTFYLLDYTKMKVSQSVELRKLLRKNSYSFKVIKNRLALRALKDEFSGPLKDCFKQPTAIAFAQEEPIALARLIRDFLTQNKVLTVKGGVVEGQAFAANRFEEICKLSSREELLGKIGYLMASPLKNFLRTWQAPLMNLGRLLSQLKTKK